MRVNNTSIVLPASRKSRRKGNPVVSDETVMYGYESSATMTTDRLHYKLQTRPLVREAAPRRREKHLSGKKEEEWKKKIRSWAPKGCTTPRHTDCLTVSRKVTSTSTYTVLVIPIHYILVIPIHWLEEHSG
jgi:hypothetical protein